MLSVALCINWYVVYLKYFPKARAQRRVFQIVIEKWDIRAPFARVSGFPNQEYFNFHVFTIALLKPAQAGGVIDVDPAMK